MVSIWRGLLFAAIIMIAANSTRVVAAPPEPEQNPLEEGVYELNFLGFGRKVILNSGSEGFLGKRLSASIGRGVRLQSCNNDNTHCRVTIKDLGPLPAEVITQQSALVLNDIVFHLGRPDTLPDSGLIDTWVNVHTSAIIQAVAKRYQLEPQFRKHPEHRCELRWTPLQQRYTIGEAVRLKMGLKNTGDSPIRFQFGGKQRGPRNNQFRFLAQSVPDGQGLPDTGSSLNFGGLFGSHQLLPGEIYSTEVDLTRWFTITQYGTYRITGILELPLLDPSDPDVFGAVIWNDLAIGECKIRIVAAEEPID